uniref:Uncharacterized protein n=1 Tax=Panagrolaimus sp. ES5 TaxID=591445 RepID=A0AC34GX84_9BILA
MSKKINHNFAETYHGKQGLTFCEKHLPLGTWIFYQREAQHGDDNKLNRVMKRYDDPPAANEDTLEADFQIDEAKLRMNSFMEDDDYEQKDNFICYSLKLGKLLSYKKTL